MRSIYKIFSILCLSFFTAAPVWAFSYWNAIDYITQEKGYLYAHNVAKSMKQSIASLPMDQSEIVLRLKNSTAINQWLRQPMGKFGSLYRHQINNQFEELPYIQSWTIYNKNKAVLLSQGERLPAETLTDQMNMDLAGFSMPLHEGNQLLGYVQAKWNLMLLPKLPTVSHSSAGIDSLWIDSQKKVIGKVSSNFQKHVKNQHYQGMQNGRQKGLRFYSSEIGDHMVVFLYPAVSYFFYVWRIGLYLLILILVFILYGLFKKYINKDGKSSLHSWADEKLKEAISINQEAISLSKEGHSVFVEKEKVEQHKTKNLLEAMENLKNNLEESQNKWSNGFDKASQRQTTSKRDFTFSKEKPAKKTQAPPKEKTTEFNYSFLENAKKN